MKNEILNPWITTLGWTLLHSLWQGAILWMALVSVRGMLPSVSSTVRYARSSVTMILLVASSITTFICLFQDAAPAGFKPLYLQWTSSLQVSRDISFGDIFKGIAAWVDSYLPSFIQLWIIGATLFGLRLIAAWWQAMLLQRSLQPIDGLWEQKLSGLAKALSIRRSITLGESAAVRSPVLLGFIKPVILFPVGMLSGLPVDQVETILLHELAHVKRHDFLVNVVQCIAEAIFFFNPFVWLISRNIRHEREECCDDMVIRHRDPLAYAKALHRLEEARAGQTLVLAAKGQPNQLLSRIRRIMEKHEKKEVSGGKIFLVLVFVFAILTASWISVQAYRRGPSPDLRRLVSDSIPTDTTVKDSKKKSQERSATYSKKSITTFDEKGQPHEEITENFEGDESLRPLMNPQEPNTSMFDKHLDENFWNGLEGDSLLWQFHVPNGSPWENSFGMMDTIPNGPFDWYQDTRDWEQFGNEFEQEFRDHFGDFYKKNKPEFEKMMKELQEKMEKSFHELNGLEGNLQHLQELQNNAFMIDSEHLRKQAEQMQKEAEQMQKNFSQRDQELFMNQAENMKEMAENLRHLDDFSLKEHEREMKQMEEQMKAFEKDLKDELVRDGYLDKEAALQNIDWSDSGIEVNGKKIKEKDFKKYQELRRKYFKGSGRFHYTE